MDYAAYDDAINAAGKAFDVDPSVLKGIAHAESGFDPNVISGKRKSPKGAIGLMQFMPDTAKRFGIDPTNPEQSVFGAAQYIRENLDRFNGDYGKAVAAYNWGEHRQAYGKENWAKLLPHETSNYVDKVLKFAAEDSQTRPAPEEKPAPDQLPATVTAPPPAPDEVPVGRYHQPPEWAQEHPDLYNAAQTIRTYGGPVLETLGGIGGAALGAPAGPVGVVGGAGAGYGAAKSIEHAADVALGNEPPMSTAGQIARSAGEVGEGALMEIGGQLVGKYAIEPVVKAGTHVAGKIADFGQRNVMKAADIARSSIGANEVLGAGLGRDAVQEVKAALAEGIGQGKLPAQILAEKGINQPVLQALLDDATRNNDVNAAKFFSDTLRAQRAESQNALAQMAGGATQAEARAAQEANVNALKAREIPVLNQVIGNVNRRTAAAQDVQNALAANEHQALESGAAATNAVNTVRRMEAFKERAPGIRPPNEVVSMPKQPFQYTLAGEMSKKAEDVSAKAAAGSLDFGEARNFAQAAADELATFNLKPLTSDSIVSQIEKMRKNVKLMPGLSDSDAVMNSVIDDLRKWSDEGGVINAWALENLRKNSVNKAVTKVVGNPDKKLEALVNSKLAPLFIDAMENAGGKGYRQYLKNYSEGMQDVARQKLATRLMDMFDNNPAELAKVARGDNPKLVEEILGPGNYDLTESLGKSTADKIASIGKQIETQAEIKGQVTSGSRAQLEKLLTEKKTLPRMPGLLSVKATITNEALSMIERDMGRKVSKEIAQAAKTPEGLLELLNTYPAKERMKILKTINESSAAIAKTPGSGIATGVTVRNALAPENRNQNALTR